MKLVRGKREGAAEERGPGAVAPPPGRQGPGPMPGALLGPLDLAVARRAGSLLPGDRAAPGMGQGTELAQLRAYQPGDDVRRLDPAASARTGIPHVRMQVPERQLTTWLVLDLSSSMAFGTADRLKSDVAEGAAMTLARLATRRGGRVGVVTCGAASERRIPPRGGRTGLVAVQRVLSEGVATDGRRDDVALHRAFSRTGRLAVARGLVIVISDFRGPRTWRRDLASLAHRHAILAVEIQDPREGRLPNVGHLSLVDPETGRHVRVDSSDRRLRQRYAAAERADRDAVAADLRQSGAQHVVLSTEGDWLRALGRAMR